MKLLSVAKTILFSNFIKRLGVFVLGVLIMGAVFIASFHFSCNSSPADFKPVEQTASNFSAIEKYNRPTANTYLSFPEWYLVFNPQEYAQFIEKHSPSDFPYFGSIAQFWTGYCKVYGISEKNYPSDLSSNITDMVIGTSFTVEYTLKGVYENTFGRITESISHGQPTSEDIYAAEVAKDYGAFIPTDPWYEFPFGQKLAHLWLNTSFFGQHFTRKIERKIFLSAEYGAKAIYAEAIKAATHTAFGVADTEIYTVIKKPSENIFKIPQVHKIAESEDQTVITLPHYQGFTDVTPILSNQGVEFISIAGNSEILITLVTPTDWQYNLDGAKLLFRVPILTTSQMRVGVQVPVRDLNKVVKSAQSQKLTIEHIYDY